jgi:hypothetical protein
MKVKAIYHKYVHDNGRVVHAVDHDHGGFSVSSEQVGIAVQNFLNNATTSDIHALHTHMLTAYRILWDEEEALGVDTHVTDDMMDPTKPMGGF